METQRSDVVLIVEDDRKTAAILSLYLAKEGFTPVTAGNGREALALFEKRRPVFILLDLMIPQLDGVEVCKRIRQTSNVPIMMVTARVDEVDRLIGLEIGADDYVVKPFSPREVVARVKAILRRVHPPVPQSGAPVRHLAFEVDPEKHQVRHRGVRVSMTALEFRLFHILFASPGHVFSREALLGKLYPTGDVNVLDRTIDVHIKNLRQKIEDQPTRPRYIKTVRSVGYQFAES